MPPSTGSSSVDVDACLIAAHEAVAKLKLFVSDVELRKLEQHQHVEGVSRARPDMPPPPLYRELVFDCVMKWIRTTVTDASTGFILPWTAAENGPSPGGDTSIASLSFLVSALTEQLEAERKAKQYAVATLSSFNNVMEGYRLENATIEAYKDRIVELQAVINHTKKYSEIDVEVGSALQPRLVPADCVASAELQRKEVANKLASVTMSMKDKMERVAADNIKLSSDRALLQAENKLLLDRCRVLEAQLTVLNASSAVTLRELDRVRVANAQLAVQTASPLGMPSSPAGGAMSTSARTLRSNATPPQQGATSATPSSASTSRDVVIGGVVIDKDVAMWLRDVYLALLKNPDAADALEVLRGIRRRPNSPESIRPQSGAIKTSSAASSRGSHVLPNVGVRGDSAGSAQSIGNTHEMAGTRSGSARSFAEHVNTVRGSSASSSVGGSKIAVSSSSAVVE